MFNIELAKQLKKHYTSNYPYPYIVIDNFFDENLLEKSLQELNVYDDWGTDLSQDEFEVNKFFSPWSESNKQNFANAAPITNYNLDFMNSKPVIDFLQELTDIKDLQPDPTLWGGGVHKINKGGQLAVHADYSYHRQTGLHRRLNLLLYLNKDWKKEYEGCLELWSPDMKDLVAEIEPVFNRAVIFNITNDALHGHPKPLNPPEGRSRLSYALYYFTKERPEEEIIKNQRDGDVTSVLWREHPSQSIQRRNSLDDLFKF